MPAKEKTEKEEAMSTENEALARRWFEEVWNQGRVEAIDALFAADGVAHGLGADGGDTRGTEEFKAFHAKFRRAFPDMHVTVEDVIASGERTAIRFSVQGTHTGDSLGIAPTQKRVAFTGMTFARWRNGQIVEGWNNIDFASLFAQLGAR
jgi:steroid delta-isomerase-like uncharacterized protein